MKTNSKVFVLFFMTLISIIIFSFNISRTEVIEGEANFLNDFNLSGQDSIDFSTDLDIYKSKKEIIQKFYTKMNSGDEETAKKILEKDSTLDFNEREGWGYEFLFYEFREINILYTPKFIISNSTDVNKSIIFCTQKQELIKSKTKKFKFKCKFYKKIITEDMKIYKLIDYK